MLYFKKWLRKTGHTLDTAALALGVSRSSVANYSKGKNRSHDTAQELPSHIRDKCEALLSDRTAYLAHHTQDKQSL